MSKPECFGKMDLPVELQLCGLFLYAVSFPPQCGECKFNDECYHLTFAGLKPKHTLHIRNLDHETYETMWNLRKFHGAGSWAKLMKKIIGEYVEMTKQEWI